MEEIFDKMIDSLIDSLGIELSKKLDYVFVCSDKVFPKYIRYKDIDCFYIKILKKDECYLMKRIDYIYT